MDLFFNQIIISVFPIGWATLQCLQCYPRQLQKFPLWCNYPCLGITAVWKRLHALLIIQVFPLICHPSVQTGGWTEAAERKAKAIINPFLFFIGHRQLSALYPWPHGQCPGLDYWLWQDHGATRGPDVEPWRPLAGRQPGGWLPVGAGKPHPHTGVCRQWRD